MSAQPEHDSARPAEAVRNPEASALVGLYRRMVPLSARRTVAGAVSGRLRNTVKNTLASSQLLPERLADQRAALAARRSPRLYGGPQRRLVKVNRRPKAAHVREFPSPLQAQAEALRLICEALETANVAYFVVRGSTFSTARVGVPVDQRRAAAAALTRLCARTAGYQVLPARRRRDRDEIRTVPGTDPAARRMLQSSETVRFCWYFTDERGTAAVGDRFGCDVEFWSRAEDGSLTAPHPNPCADTLPPGSTPTAVPLTRMGPLLAAAPDSADTVRTVPEFSQALPEDVRFPVDAVYTWVNGNDPAWLRRRATYAGEGYHEEAANPARYLSRDELRYSLRSLAQYAPWVRHVYLVTDDQVPEWLNTDHPGITVVNHREIFSDPTVLPTFNSHAIESQLHHIDGLAEHFLYLNDDVFLGQLTVPQDFFLASGLSQFFQSKAHVPFGQPSSEDVPVSVAGKNNRAVIEERFGAVLTQKMKHVPHALQRSVLYEIEEEFADRHRTTAANRFRELNDLSVTSSLHHYYAFLTGQAVPGDMEYSYFDLAHPNTAARLGRLLAARDRTAFCLNDTVSNEADLAQQLAIMQPFLQAYFPFVSPFERTNQKTSKTHQAEASTATGMDDDGHGASPEQNGQGQTADGSGDQRPDGDPASAQPAGP